MSAVASVERDLRAAVSAEIAAPSSAYLTDQTEARGIAGRADAVALPRSAEEVAGVVAWCYSHGVPIVPRGGGTGYAGGAVPLDGGVVISLERLDRVRSFDPLLWRIEVDAGVRTAELRRIAREGGLLFPPDPGAAEQSQIGGNVATNAGGPHAFKYGVTGAWVTGLEVVVPPGEVVQLGGALRKDVAGYDLKHLLVGSEGTLGVITAAWLRLTPAPEAAWPVIGFFDGVRGGVGAIERVVGSGLAAAALEYIDSETMRYAGASFPGEVPGGAFAVLAEADGSTDDAARIRADLLEVFGEDALALYAPKSPRGDRGALALARRVWRSSSTHSAVERRAKTSQCLSTASVRRSKRHSRSAAVSGSPLARGATPATATCTRRSCSPVTTIVSSSSPRSSRRRSSSWRSASAARSPANTASASSSATGSRGSSVLARSSSMARSSARSTRRTC